MSSIFGGDGRCYFGVFLDNSLPPVVKKQVQRDVKTSGINPNSRMGFRSEEAAMKFLEEDMSKFADKYYVAEYMDL